MATFPSATLALLHSQVGHITTSQLAENGIGRAARQRLVAAGVLERPYKSVYRLPTKRPTLEKRLIALSLAHPAGFITGPSAGGYLGLRRMPKVSSLHLCLPHGARIEIPVGVKLRQSTKMDETDRRTLPNGMIVASWPRLVVDLAADLSPRSLASVMDQVLALGHATRKDMDEAARRLCHPGRVGSELFLRTLMDGAGRKPVDSDGELHVLRGLHERGVPVEAQHSKLRLPNGRWVRIDLAVPAVRWAVEVDLHPGHLGLHGTTNDKQRDRQLHMIDWQVERLTALDLFDLPAVLDELAELYHRRVSTLAA